VVNRIVEISEAGRAPKNEPALFALALVMTYGNSDAKASAYEALPKVARIGTHLLHLAEYVNSMRGWGRGIRRAFGNWYTEKSPKALATNLVKYANRDGWTHRDVLRLAHPAGTGVHQQLLAYAADKPSDFSKTDIAGFMSAVEEIKQLTESDVKRAVRLIADYELPREVVPTQLLNSPNVWAALLPHMGLTAMVRNAATMTRVGVLSSLSSGEKLFLQKLGDVQALTKARVHPIQMLSALRTYESGHGARGTNVWTPNKRISAALEDAFPDAVIRKVFGEIQPLSVFAFSSSFWRSGL